MKKMLAVTGGVAGLLYGIAAAVFAYSDSPLPLRAFIGIGVGVVGASAGWLVGLIGSNLPLWRRRRQVD